MKPPEEIKKELALHEEAGKCKECPYTADTEFKKTYFQLVAAYTLAYIRQFESRLAQAEREKKALLYDLQHVAPVEICDVCAYVRQREAPSEKYDFHCDACPEDCHCRTCCGENFDWRGVCPENTEESDDV